MQENHKIVEVKNLSHRYGNHWAIRDINFGISGAGVVGLLGANGAGKSTMMNIICGALKQTQGDVFINGVSLKQHPIQAKRFIGFLPQNAPLHLDLTVDEYLRHCADLRQMPVAQIPEAMQRVKERCGITQFGSRLLKNLSGGYKQRVGIAQAIIHDPLFVILDEPTNGLDPNQILAVRELIQEIATQRAVLISTHILSEVQALCHEIKMIDSGQIVFSGSLAEFNGYMAPSSMITVMNHQPDQATLMQIPGVTQVESLTRTRSRLYFNGPETLAETITALALKSGWELREIYTEKESLNSVFAKLSGK